MIDETYTEKLARWSCTLNHWEWPEDLPGKPEGFDDFPNIIKDGEDLLPNKYDWTGSIMKSIEKRIGRKEVLRWHHLHNLNHTNEEFQNWWANA